ncbi:MAG: hypothetical protein GY947_02265 [Rhodobacteraceae bacterium]|nr:hypothetical protein [Paracoccaceae bacterium]
MRLVCPRCVAQYEVDDGAIPETGCEVQCANCEHVWYQDSIQMLPDREPAVEKTELAAESFQSEQGEIFDDLEGVGDAEFRSARPEDSDIQEKDQTDDAFDEEEDDYDDPPGDLPEGAGEVDEEVLDVLRSEAAFSSARATLDATLDDESEATDEPTGGLADAEDEPEDLSAFLDAHADAASPESDEVEVDAEADQEPDGEFDPLRDLGAIRSQLSEMQEAADSGSGAESEYEPVLPREDVEDEPTAEDPDDEFSDLTSILDAEDDEDAAPEVDDALDPQPRRAYRADSDWLDETGDDDFEVDTDEEFDLDEEEPDDEEAGSAIPAAAALGSMRPRPSGNVRVRAPSVLGVREALEEEAEELADLAANAPSEPVERPKRPQQAEAGDKTERPGAAASRKELLPDVDELDSTLRSEAAKPSRELESVGEEDEVPSSGGFRRAFIWTLFIFALLAAVYVYRADIKETFPASAAVLDPYVGFVNGLRGSIDEIVAYVRG